MRKKRKYKKRAEVDTAYGGDLEKIAGEIKTLINEITTSHVNTLLSIRADLIRARARIKERAEG